MTRGTRTTIVAAVVALVAGLVAPVGAALGDSEPMVVALDETNSVAAVAGEFLIDLDGIGPEQAAFLDVEPVGFGWGVLRDSTSVDPLSRAVQLRTELGTEVIPNLVSQLAAVNSEPNAEAQWGLDNTGQLGGVDDADIDAVEAWDVTKGGGAVVAVLDTGADLDHQDLAPNFWVNSDEIAGNGVDDDNNGYVDDVNGWDFVGNDNASEDDAGVGTGHGSAVAGVAGAPINNDGIAGVAPDADLMILRVCGAAGCSDADVIEALAYASANGADVANLSFGRESFFPAPLEAAVQGAVDAGVTVIIAAGNSADDNDTTGQYPANFTMSGMLAVTATDRTDTLASFGNFGATTVDLGAPGVEIETVAVGGGWTAWDGTSFSAPMVSGAAALVAANDACAGPATAEARLRDRGDAIGGLAGVTISGKRLNAMAALTTTAVKNDVVAAGAPMAVRFNGGTAGTEWTFGDGETAVGSSVVHVFEFGAYEVTNDTSPDTWTVAAGIQFTDTCTISFHDEIVWLSAAEIASGCSTGEFCPTDDLTRAQMATLLVNALDLPAATQDFFTDDNGLFHEPNINALAASGITSGCATGEFCPDDTLTRAQMASLLARAFGLTGGDNAFTDDDGLVHEPNINALAASGITSGCAAGLFCPDDPVLRMQMAAFLFRSRTYLP